MMNTTKSEQIRAGLQKSFRSGTSAKASTVCYSYRVTSTGDLRVYSILSTKPSNNKKIISCARNGITEENYEYKENPC